ncbi:hypothetical protein O9929_11945 [Vibrio lentus]|nr:hypothetical protein [Vibrio lentus]
MWVGSQLAGIETLRGAMVGNVLAGTPVRSFMYQRWGKSSKLPG